MKRNMIRLVTLLGAFPVSGIVMAHTGSHEVSGFISGINHPLTGLDHLTVMLAVGLWAGICTGRRAWVPVMTFLIFMAGGMALGLGGIGLPGVEAGIATSVLIMGVLVATLARLPAAGSVVLMGVFALFHGSVHGSEMPNTIMPVWYGLGLLTTTAALHLSGIGVARLVERARAEWLLRGAGITVGGFGALLLLGA